MQSRPVNEECRGQLAAEAHGPGEPTATEEVRRWLQRRQPGWSLPQTFYTSEAVYRADLAGIWRRGWLFAGHTCEIPAPGDYFTLEVDRDSLVVVHGEDGAIRAFHNVCRHRGSLVCLEPAGHVKRLVCPYHQWTYGLDGALLSWRGMQPELNRAAFGLRPVQAEEVEGLIFVCLAAEPPPFAPARQALAPLLQPQGLRRAKVARAVDYLVRANWKIVWENNRECYHCNVNHPQYIKANFDHYNADDTTPLVRARLAEAAERVQARWAAAGIATHTQTGMTRFPDAEHGVWFSANRTPLAEGYVSETMDGRPVAPLMGAYRDTDVGTLRLRTLPNFWNHSSCDHGVSTRLLPAGPQRTAIRVYWLVEAQAVEGRDYELSKLLPFWQLTSEQDWTICENQQRGINSSAYTPGPYSTFKEYNVEAFVRWYVQSLLRNLTPGNA